MRMTNVAKKLRILWCSLLTRKLLKYFLNPMFNSCVTNKCSSSNKQFSIHPVTITSMAKFDVLKVSDNSELNIDTKIHKKGLRQSAKSEGYYYCCDCYCYGGET